MRKFKTESKKLLDLMINSIYTNREIFLRELISNASDAVDKLYFRSLTDPSVAVGRDDLAITVGFSADERTVTVSDNGIGMTKDELDKNLGTIAHSDSFEFKAAQAEAAAESEPARRRGSTTSPTWTSSAVRRRLLLRLYGGQEGARRLPRHRKRRDLGLGIRRRRRLRHQAGRAR